jgi:uncharacterized protein (DUF1810 family)
MARNADPFERFVEAQSSVWMDVQAELRAGRKASHWMWFVFPQLAALGRSATAKFYGLRDGDEARAYMAHPVLGPRLLECCEILLQVPQHDAVAIFGGVDAMKLRSCLTLFAHAAPQRPQFGACLQKFFGGEADPLTLGLLGPERGHPTASCGPAGSP